MSNKHYNNGETVNGVPKKKAKRPGATRVTPKHAPKPRRDKDGNLVYSM